MLASLLQDVAIRSHLLVHHEALGVQSPPTSTTSTSQSSNCLVNLLIDFDSVASSDVTCLPKVEKVLAGLLARQMYLTATVYWSGTPVGSATGDLYLHPTIDQSIVGLIRVYIPKFRKDSISFVMTSEPAYRMAVLDALESPLHNKHSTLVCSTSNEVLHSGAHVCRNIDRFLIDGTALEIFVPERLVSLFPAFQSKSNVRYIIPQVEFLLQRGFTIGTPRSDEPLALQMYRQCEHQLQSDPIASVIWMLQRVSYAAGIPVFTRATAERLFPAFSSLDQPTQEKWLDLTNQDPFTTLRRKKVLPGGVDDLGVVIGSAIGQCYIGPWCIPRGISGGGVSERSRWWSKAEVSKSWFDALAPIRSAIDSIIYPSLSAVDEAHDNKSSSLPPSSIWPTIQRSVDPFALWKMLAIRVPTQSETPSYFRVTAPLAADLAAPNVMHPAMYLTFALLAGSMQLYEWEWVALLTCCCANSVTALNPLFRCSRGGLTLAINGFLSVYEHVCRLNEVCNGAFFPVVHLSKLPQPTDAMVGTPIPSVAMFHHLLTTFSDESINRQQAHEQYAAVVRDHGTCCAFANPSYTAHLSIYHRVLVTALRQ